MLPHSGYFVENVTLDSVAGCLNRSFFVPGKGQIKVIGDHGVVGFKWMAAQCLTQIT